MATPGEFTKRAFMNGKLDLSQAEAVADLIAAQSKKAHQIALSQLKGNLSSDLKVLREQLMNFASLVELELDFAEEDVEFADRAIVSDEAGTTRDVIEETLNIEGILFRLIDTAEIRETTQNIEAMGIERSQKKIKEAAIVLCL